LKDTYSQFGQDLYVADVLFQGKKGGVFLDIGAHDGISLSNTYLLEKKHGWTGICIEALPEVFSKLIKSRDCICVNAAATRQGGEQVEFEKIDGYGEMLSGMVENYDPKHLERISKEQEAHGFSTSRILVDTVSPADVLIEHGLTDVDYVSIDIEGGELGALQGLMGKGINIKVLGIENNYKDGTVKKFMKEHGYARFSRIKTDDFFKPEGEVSFIEQMTASFRNVRN